MELTIEELFISADKRPEEDFDPYTDNTDVIVRLSDEKIYAASFFAYKNIQRKAAENRAANEFLNGKYFWVKSLILIECCSKELITKVVQEMIDEGEFLNAFYQL